MIELKNNIFFDEYYNYYINFGKYIFTNINGFELYEINEQEKENLLKSKEYISLSNIDIDNFLFHLSNKIDNYNIIEENNFFKIGRIFNYKKNNKIILGIIIYIEKQFDYEFNKDILKNIKILDSNGNISTFNKEYISENIRPTINDDEITIDKIIEILSFYEINQINDFNYYNK